MFKTRWFQCRLVWNFWKKEVKRCWAAAAMCNDKQGVELYPATSAIEKNTSLTITSNLPHNADAVWKVSRNARSSCDEQSAVMRLRVSTQHLHSLDTNTLVQQCSTGPVGKKGAGLSSSSPGQCVSKCFWSLKATILDPQVLTDGQL